MIDDNSIGNNFAVNNCIEDYLTVGILNNFKFIIMIFLETGDLEIMQVIVVFSS
jgi:hypothetical protein